MEQATNLLLLAAASSTDRPVSTRMNASIAAVMSAPARGIPLAAPAIPIAVRNGPLLPPVAVPSMSAEQLQAQLDVGLRSSFFNANPATNLAPPPGMPPPVVQNQPAAPGPVRGGVRRGRGRPPNPNINLSMTQHDIVLMIRAAPHFTGQRPIHPHTGRKMTIAMFLGYLFQASFCVDIFPVRRISWSVGMTGSHAPVTWRPVLVDMLDTMTIRFTMGFECGKKEKHFHFQVMMDVHIKDVDTDHFNAFKMFVKAALPETDGVQIRIKTAESDAQTQGGCFGYVFKDWGKPHFLKDSKGFTEQECLTMYQEHQQFATNYTVL
jgi:hypothetical protein